MILVTTGEASRDWDGLTRHITDILTRAGAQEIDLKKWGEFKLAYEINHQRKAIYILVHFQAPPNVIAELRRELHLSERILRHILLLDADGVEVKLLSDLEEERERIAGEGRPPREEGRPGGDEPTSDDRGRDAEEESAPSPVADEAGAG
jgi:ribosomal protein S6